MSVDLVGTGLINAEKPTVTSPEQGVDREEAEPRTAVDLLTEEIYHYRLDRDYNFALGNLNGDCIQELVDVAGAEVVIKAMRKAYSDEELTQKMPSLAELMRIILDQSGQNTPEGRTKLINQVKAKTTENHEKYEQRLAAGQVDHDEEFDQISFGYGPNGMNIKTASISEAEQDLTTSKWVKTLLDKVIDTGGRGNLGLELMVGHFDSSRIQMDLQENSGDLMEAFLKNDQSNRERGVELLQQAMEESERLQQEVTRIRQEYFARYLAAVKPFKESAKTSLEALGGENPDTQSLVNSTLESLSINTGELKNRLIQERDEKLSPLNQQLLALNNLVTFQLNGVRMPVEDTL